MFAGTRVVVGVGAGVGGYGYGYAAPAPVVVYAGPRYGWHAGPYWVAPRYYGHRYFRGYWHR
jgi:hypothetical protein